MAPLVNKKRVSKKKKIAWRKHCDTKDVDNFLEDKRLEERLGFTVSEKPDEELFQIDKAPDEGKKISNDNYSKNLWEVTVSNDTDVKSKHKSPKPLKCFEILIPQSAVQDPITKRNRVRTTEERKHPLVKKLEAERRKLGILKAKEISAIRNRVVAAAKRQNKPNRGEFLKDLWGSAPDKDADPLGKNAEWLTPMTLQHTLKNVGKLKKKMPPAMHQKTSLVPAVVTPHPGMSYNPSFTDHQQLLKEVADKEVKLIKEEKHLDRVTTKMFSRVTSIAKDNSWMSEMSEGLPKFQAASTKGVEAAEEEDEKSNEYTTVNPPVKNKKKTPQQRKKQKAARREELQRKSNLTEKKKISDIYKLKFLDKQFEAKERKLAKLRAKRERVKALKAKEPKQLSKTKFEPPELEFNMAGDLRGSLRCIKKEGNLLDDRFKSLQRRNVVEPTVKQKIPKRGKHKVFQKASHRMSWEL